jgi:hypothetical protein
MEPWQQCLGHKDEQEDGSKAQRKCDSPRREAPVEKDAAPVEEEPFVLPMTATKGGEDSAPLASTRASLDTDGGVMGEGGRWLGGGWGRRGWEVAGRWRLAGSRRWRRRAGGRWRRRAGGRWRRRAGGGGVVGEQWRGGRTGRRLSKLCRR